MRLIRVSSGLIIFLLIMLLSAPDFWAAIPLEKNALIDGLIKIFPELKSTEESYIDLDRSGDSRSEPGVPEIIWDRPGAGQGEIQAQEVLDVIVYKDNYRYLAVAQLSNVKRLLDNVGVVQAGGGTSKIMTKKVARSYSDELADLIALRKKLPDIVTKNERRRVADELIEVMQRMSKQYAEEADKEASGTFKQDVEKFKAGMDVVRIAEEHDPMELPFEEFDDEKGTARNSMVRIVGDEVKNHNERYIGHDMGIFSVGKIGGRNAMNILIAILQDLKFENNKKDTIEALGMIGEECTPEAVRIIGQYLDSSPDKEVKIAAIRTLGKVGSKEAIGILKKYVESPPEEMPSLRDHALNAMVNITENERKKGISSRELIPLFKRFAKSKRIDHSSKAMKGLAFINNIIPYEEIWRLLFAMGDTPDPDVMDDIVSTIQLVAQYNKDTYKRFFTSTRGGESKRIVLYLQDCFSGGKKEYLRRHPRTRIKIGEVLKEICVAVPWLEGLNSLIPGLVDPDPRVSDATARFLIDASWDYLESGTQASYKYSVPIMTYRMIIKRKDTPRILEKGIRVIGKQAVSFSSVIEFIFAHLEDLDVAVVRQTVRALASLINDITRTPKFHVPKRLELVRALIVKSTLPIDIRMSAVIVAGNIGFSDAKSSGNNIVKALLEVLNDRNAPVDLKVAAILNFPRLNEKQGRIHKHWVALKDKVTEYAGRGDMETRKAALLALRDLALDTEKIRTVLYNGLTDKENQPLYYEILDAIDKVNSKESSEHIRSFIITVKDLDPKTRRLAVRVLSNCGDPDMVDVLVDALSDPVTADEAERGLEQLEREAIEKRIKQRISRETDPEVKKRLQNILQR